MLNSETFLIISAIFGGLKPAVVAIVIVALIKISKKSLNNFFSYLIAFLSFISIYFFHIPFPFIIISAIILSLLINYLKPDFASSNDKSEFDSQEENNYYINKYSILEHTKPDLKIIISKVFVFILLWIIPLILFQIFSENKLFWKDLILFFTKAAFITFGGAYSVLTYIAQVTVENFHWLSKLQMIDGLALGETTPGPLIMVLSFVGFMAGYNNLGSSVSSGTLGLFTTIYYTFLPSFLFILIGAPFIEMTRDNEKIKSAFGLVTAVVTGVILNLTVYVAAAVIFPNEIIFGSINYFSLIWIIISFAALYFYKMNMIKWIGLSALIGILHYFIIS